SAAVGVPGGAGRIIAVNDGWIRLTRDEGAIVDADVDSNYVDVCRARAREALAAAGEAQAGTQAVLAGSRPSFALEYAIGAPPADRWFAMVVLPLNRPEGG